MDYLPYVIGGVVAVVLAVIGFAVGMSYRTKNNKRAISKRY